MFVDRKQQKQIIKPLKSHKKQQPFNSQLSPLKQNITANNQVQYLSPMNIKSPKYKSKNKKQAKNEKQDIGQLGLKMKGKRSKKNRSQLNGVMIGNQNLENKFSTKENKGVIKIINKYDDKKFRQTEKKFKKLKKQEKDIFSKKTLTNFSKEKPLKMEIKLPRQQQQYLFLGDQFYLINNYCPTKRLLNTFRDALANSDNIEGKYLPQDNKNDNLVNKKVEFKRNIFTAAREYIEIKNKVSKVIMIQRWWRRFKSKLKDINLDQSNPQFQEFSQSSHSSWSNNLSRIQSINNMISKSNINNNNINNNTDPSKKDKSQPKQKLLQSRHLRLNQNIVSDILIFDSSELMQAPKKVHLKKQMSPEKMLEEYKIPQNCQSDHNENEQIFANFNKFIIKQANQYLNNNQDSQEDESSQNLNNSPIKSQQQFLNPDDLKNMPVVQSNTYNILQEFQEATKIRQQIDFRLLLQKGQIKLPQTAHSKIGISTSIISIHQFLVKFFHFYIQHNKQEFLSFINMPFGHSITSRLRHLRGEKLPSEPEEDEQGILFGLQYIIDDKKYEDFCRHVMRYELNMSNSFAKANNQLDIIHNKAIIDIFNQELNKYRPYCQIHGVPYPWNHSYKALTFYFVTEENILEVFQKIQLKILQDAALLCGIHLHSTINPSSSLTAQNQQFDLGKFMLNYQSKSHGLVYEHNQAKQIKLIQEQLKQQTFEYDSQDHAYVMLDMSEFIFEQFLMENIIQIQAIFNKN